MPPVLRVAHRGHPAARRENTLDGFAHALDVGCDWLEVDVRTTRDGRSIVLHDTTLRRLWGLPAAAAEVDWEQIRRLGGASDRVPLLEEVLELAASRSARVLIDSTTPRDALAAAQVAASLSLAIEVACCGSSEAMLALRREYPAAPLQYGHRGGPLDLDLLTQIRPFAVNAEWTDWSSALVTQVHELGLQAWAWTANEAAVMRWLLGLGVDAITTDQIRLLGTVCQEQPRQPESVSLPTALPAAELQRSLAVAGRLADWAAAYTRDAPLGEVTAKAHPADLVTEVDTAIEERARTIIAAELPGHTVVGEEQGGEPGAGPTWYLDPVDGTTNLASRIPWTGFSLALAVGDQPYVAAVTQPWLGEILLAGYGLGATRNGQPLSLDGRPRLQVMLTELAAHEAWPGMARLFRRAAAQHVTLRVMGSGTLTLAGIAAGWGQAAVIHAFCPIDHLAALLLVREAGGVVWDEQGHDVLFPAPGTGILAAHPQVAEQAFDLWRRS